MIKKELKCIAGHFGLKYYPRASAHLFTSKENIVLHNFLSGCPEPDYDCFGRSTPRVKNIVAFVHSKEFERHSKLPQGTVISLKSAFSTSVFTGGVSAKHIDWNKKTNKDLFSVQKMSRCSFS